LIYGYFGTTERGQRDRTGVYRDGVSRSDCPERNCYGRGVRENAREAGVTVPPALLSHESTEHYPPQYILDAVIACRGAIDPDPCSNSREIPYQRMK